MPNVTAAKNEICPHAIGALLKNASYDFVHLGKGGVIESMYTGAACDIFGETEIVGKTLFSLIFSELKETMGTQDLTSAQMIADCIGEMDVLYDSLSGDFPKKITFSNGDEEKVIALSYKEARADGVISNLVVMIRDITDAEQAQHAAQAEKAASEEKAACLLCVASLSAATNAQLTAVLATSWAPLRDAWQQQDLKAFKTLIVEFQNALDVREAPYFSQMLARTMKSIRVTVMLGDDADWDAAETALTLLAHECADAYRLLQAYSSESGVQEL